MRVKALSPDDIAEIYDLLTCLEATAAELAATRGLSSAEFAALDKTVVDMDKALGRGDIREWAKVDQRFHDLLPGGPRNKRLQDVVAALRDQAHRVRMATLMLRPMPTDSNEDHQAVIKAIRDRDAESARAIHHDHRKKSGAMLVELLTRMGLSAL